MALDRRAYYIHEARHQRWPKPPSAVSSTDYREIGSDDELYIRDSFDDHADKSV